MSAVIIALVVFIIILIMGTLYYYSTGQMSAIVPFSYCETSAAQFHPSCPVGKTVVIDEAKYGRYDTATCMSPSSSANKLCDGTSILSKLTALCTGKQDCQLTGSMNTAFGDPCPGISKHMVGTYHCA